MPDHPITPTFFISILCLYLPVRKLSLYTMSLLYTGAGINHLWHPAPYLKVMPVWVGHHECMVLITGILEIILGLLLLPGHTRRLAAWGIIVLLLCIFPANIQMVVNYYMEQHPQLWITILRLPLQILLIGWAYRVARKGVKINRQKPLYRGHL